MRSLRCSLFLVAVLVVAAVKTTSAQAPDTAWSRIHLTNSAALSLHELPDSGLVMGGYVTPEGELYRDFFIVRTDAGGDTLWTSAIGDTGRHESAECLYPTADCGFILTGTRAEDPPFAHVSNIYLVKTDQYGDLDWDTEFGTDESSEVGEAVVQTPAGGYIIAGYLWSYGTGYDIWMIGTNSLGVRTWQDLHNWADADYPTAISLAPDLGFAVSGLS